MRRHTHAQPGQALILFAIMLVALVAMVGLALDGGNVFVQHRTVSITADAAALAATRAFVEAHRQGASASTINAVTYSAAADYIAARLGTSNVNFTVSYYLNNNDPTNQYYLLTGPTDGTTLSTQMTTAGSELLVRGIEVEIELTFRTFFVQILQINTATANEKGLGYFGYLGSAVGEDVVPLGVDMSGGNILRNGGDYRIKLFNDYPTNPPNTAPPTYDIYPFFTAMLQFTPNLGVSPTPGCSGSSGSLQYDWCAGSPTPIEISNIMTATAYPYPSALRSYVQQRMTNGRDIVLVPEYYTDTATGKPNIQGFVAVKLIGIDRDALIVRYMAYFYTSGSISGRGNGIPGAYAINLVR